MSTIRLLLDEDVWPGLAAVLRERGFDVVHTYEVGRGGMPDADQLADSAQDGRAILTHNAKDFVPLAIEYYFNEYSHAGVERHGRHQRDRHGLHAVGQASVCFMPAHHRTGRHHCTNGSSHHPEEPNHQA